LASLPDPDTVLITTSASAETPSDIAPFGEYADITRRHGVPMIVVNLVCDEGQMLPDWLARSGEAARPS